MDFRRYRREQLLEKHGVDMEFYMKALDASDKLCEAIKNRDLKSVEFSDFEFRLLELWSTVIENERASIEGKRIEG
jgi:hypothetical protein